jgi:hypothetical protein
MFSVSHHESNHPAAEIYMPASVTKNMLRRFVVPLIGRQREEEKKLFLLAEKRFLLIQCSAKLIRIPCPLEKAATVCFVSEFRGFVGILRR